MRFLARCLLCVFSLVFVFLGTGCIGINYLPNQYICPDYSKWDRVAITDSGFSVELPRGVTISQRDDAIDGIPRTTLSVGLYTLVPHYLLEPFDVADLTIRQFKVDHPVENFPFYGTENVVLRSGARRRDDLLYCWAGRVDGINVRWESTVSGISSVSRLFYERDPKFFTDYEAMIRRIAFSLEKDGKRVLPASSIDDVRIMDYGTMPEVLRGVLPKEQQLSGIEKK